VHTPTRVPVSSHNLTKDSRLVYAGNACSSEKLGLTFFFTDSLRQQYGTRNLNRTLPFIYFHLSYVDVIFMVLLCFISNTV
jgi:hypothetical protein